MNVFLFLVLGAWSCAFAANASHAYGHYQLGLAPFPLSHSDSFFDPVVVQTAGIVALLLSKRVDMWSVRIVLSSRSDLWIRIGMSNRSNKVHLHRDDGLLSKLSPVTGVVSNKPQHYTRYDNCDSDVFSHRDCTNIATPGRSISDANIYTDLRTTDCDSGHISKHHPERRSADRVYAC
ncbi:hypothetical protein EXIGLDRAFT_698796 [Exidia glandulosa HHB12029]|uniref:Uncharacterized protein n=1 Tax=Exidia glandulosa HHB12029 TaxID=1314781 RepID=A0A165E354_EXIGL|nr:hypothetical protein EXIGLDRAFT_698796 [Exidia glandulosa HHB12029]